jgi:hypothetical protein
MVIDDQQIRILTAERKPALEPALLVPTGLKGRHREPQHQVLGANGSGFRLIVRQSVLDPSDFSVILGYELPTTTAVFRLRRHNGDSHDHPNRIEGTKVRGFHVHLATGRYQIAGFREDGYAEPTNSYADLAGAISCMLAEAHFDPPAQTALAI